MLSNGTMTVLPGYHRDGCIPRQRGSDPSKGFHDPIHNIDPRELPPANTLNELKSDYNFDAGTVAVHDVMLPHSSLPNASSQPRRTFNLRFCSAEGVLGAASYSNPFSAGQQSTPREFILLCGEDKHGRGVGRLPSWRGGGGGCCYTGEEGIDTSRHERPADEPGSYSLTNVRCATQARL